MEPSRVPGGSYVRLAKEELQAVIERLKELGYRTMGPHVADGAIVYDDMGAVQDLPIGILDEQDGGKYRLNKREEPTYFDYVVGPHSLKNFLFPSRETVLESDRSDGSWKLRVPPLAERPLAVIGPRSCDLNALRIQDHIFMRGEYVDPGYQARRASMFILAVNCRRAAATCFCHSMKTGPALRTGFDLGFTELNGYFIVQVGSDRGGEVITAAGWMPCSLEEIENARELPKQLLDEMRQRPENNAAGTHGDVKGRYLDTTDIRDLLVENPEHPRWEEVARRCLACANCTMVCPTCFCSYVDDVSDLLGDHVQRIRSWASCFTAEHSYMSSGTVRRTTLARYRQWLTHKLATWHDQFGTSGCTGCGRCITWCPVGIDLTEEVAAIRGENA
ncbi:MAG: 4Fe-4S dicluster domain-containing protein [Pirellulaceae bacterium]